MMNSKHNPIDTLETEDIQSAEGLAIFCRNVFGTGDVRIVTKDGVTISKARAEVETLTDGSEIFRVVLGAICLAFLAALMTTPAAAQSMSCYKLTPSTTACEFADGHANVTTLIGDSYTNTDYTSAEWEEAKAGYAAATQAVILELQKQANEWHALSIAHNPREKCEAKGGKWKSTRFVKCQLPKGGR